MFCLCILALIGSAYPGILEQYAFFALVLAIPIAMAGGVYLLVAILTHRKGIEKKKVPAKQNVKLFFGIILITVALIAFEIPLQIGFLTARSEFNRLVQSQPSANGATSPLPQWAGVYRVHKIAKDSRGGTYIQVYQGSDGMGPDTMSYGFAYEPNSKGTPFGAARLKLKPLGKGWFYFRASNDWN